MKHRLAKGILGSLFAVAALAGCGRNASPPPEGVNVTPAANSDDIRIYEVKGGNYDCHVAVNVKRYEPAGIDCTRTNETPLKDQQVDVTGDVRVIVDAKNGCFIAQNVSRYEGAGISCPRP